MMKTSARLPFDFVRDIVAILTQTSPALRALHVGALLLLAMAGCGQGGMTGPGGDDGGGSAPSPSAALITQLEPAEYETDTLESGVRVYVDREYTVDGLPGDFSGASFVRTANDDKRTTGDSVVVFELTDTATVAVAYDVRATRLPDWLQGWSATGEVLATTDVNYEVYTRDFGPGRVALGGNLAGGAEGAESMYFMWAMRTGSPPDGGGDDGGGDGGNGDPSAAPAEPSSLSVTAVSSNRVSGEFTDNSDNEESFEVFRDTGDGFEKRLTLEPDATSFTDTGLEPETEYLYRVRAVNSAGASSFSNEASATTPAQSTGGGGERPNEPAGYVRIAEANFNADIAEVDKDQGGGLQTPSTWAGIQEGEIIGYRGLSGTGVHDDPNVTTVDVPGAPMSPSQALQIRFPEGFPSAQSDDPGLLYLWNTVPDGGSGITQYSEFYASEWVRLPKADYEITNKVKILGYFGTGDGTDELATEIIKISVEDQGGPRPVGAFELRFHQQDRGINTARGQNVTSQKLFTAGEWHHIEFQAVLNDPANNRGTNSDGSQWPKGDGVFRLWVDGTLVMEHTDVQYINDANPGGFIVRTINPIYDASNDTKTRDDFVQWDHIYLSGVPK